MLSLIVVWVFMVDKVLFGLKFTDTDFWAQNGSTRSPFCMDTFKCQFWTNTTSIGGWSPFLFFFASNLLVQISGHKMAALRACFAWPLSSDSFEQTEQAMVDEVLFFFFFFLLQIYWCRLLGTKWQHSRPILDTFQCHFWTNRTRNGFKNWCVYIFYFIHSDGVCDVPLVWFCLKKCQFYCH